MSLIERDKKVVWHPFTQHQGASNPLPVVKAKGAYLIDDKGKSYLDLISSWWVNLHGHAHPKIAEAIYKQSLTLEHTLFASLTHEPGVQLAESLINLTRNQFGKAFYSDNGSTAVEVALKMAYQYWRNKGYSKRTRIIAFNNAYHGDTFGAMSVGKKSGFFSHFEDLFFEVDFFEYPATWMSDEEITQKEIQVLDHLQNYLERHGFDTAALIIEPLVQGASGMHMCRPEFLQKLEGILEPYGILTIYDEAMTGFGRIGVELFSFEKANTKPDFLCLAKSITGGFLPLAVTLCHEKIYDSFLGESFDKAFGHGHSYTANPLACAAALASLELLLSSSTLNQIQMIAETHEIELHRISKLPSIEKARMCGTIAAFDLKIKTGYSSKQSIELRQTFLRNGLLIRPIGNVIYLLPPYCVTQLELKQTYEVLENELGGDLRK